MHTRAMLYFFLNMFIFVYIQFNVKCFFMQLCNSWTCESPEVTLCGWRGYKPSIHKQTNKQACQVEFMYLVSLARQVELLYAIQVSVAVSLVSAWDCRSSAVSPLCGFFVTKGDEGQTWLTLTAPTSLKCDNRAQPRRRQTATSGVREETTA